MNTTWFGQKALVSARIDELISNARRTGEERRLTSSAVRSASSHHPGTWITVAHANGGSR